MVPGAFVDRTGSVVGRHEGAAGFTIGQRRGLPALGRPHYVVDVDVPGGRVTVASRDEATRRVVTAHACNWIDRAEPPADASSTLAVVARIRHASAPVSARLTNLGHGRVRVSFDAPVFAPAPGQALVAYEEGAVLCGGTIVAEERAEPPL